MLILVYKNSKHVALSSDKISFGVKDTSFPNVLRIMAEKKMSEFYLGFQRRGLFRTVNIVINIILSYKKVLFKRFILKS